MARKSTPTITRDPQTGRYQREPGRTWNTSASNSRQCSSRLTTGLLSLLGGAGVGAAVMYLLDPEAGARRRESARDAANRALESTTDALSSAYEGTSHALGDAWESVSHKAADVSAAAAGALPSTRDMRKSGRRLFNRASSSASDTANSWLGSARSYMPHFGERRGVSGTTAGLGAAGALLLGVGAMWLLDPARGRGRRAWLLQKGNHLVNETGTFMCATGRHLRNKMQGYTHDAASLFRKDEPSDDQLAQRVRSELGRMGFPGSSIGVHAESGRVILTGRCVTDDIDRILGGVRGVHGVSEIDNQLLVGERYETTAPSTSPNTGNISA